MQPSKRKRINTGWCGFDSHTSYQENKNPGGKRKVKGCDKVIIKLSKSVKGVTDNTLVWKNILKRPILILNR